MYLKKFFQRSIDVALREVEGLDNITSRNSVYPRGPNYVQYLPRTWFGKNFGLLQRSYRIVLQIFFRSERSFGSGNRPSVFESFPRYVALLRVVVGRLSGFKTSWRSHVGGLQSTRQARSLTSLCLASLLPGILIELTPIIHPRSASPRPTLRTAYTIS